MVSRYPARVITCKPKVLRMYITVPAVDISGTKVPFEKLCSQFNLLVKVNRQPHRCVFGDYIPISTGQPSTCLTTSRHLICSCSPLLNQEGLRQPQRMASGEGSWSIPGGENACHEDFHAGYLHNKVKMKTGDRTRVTSFLAPNITHPQKQQRARPNRLLKSWLPIFFFFIFAFAAQRCP